MSSKSIKRKFKNIIEENIPEEPVDVKELVIAFSDFIKSKSFIYNGNEKIPFNKRHPIYQAILRNEFTTELKHNTKK